MAACLSRVTRRPRRQAPDPRRPRCPPRRWAFHTFGGLDTPPVTELVRLPDGRYVRTMAANEALKAKVDALQRKRAEFFKLDIGEGVHADGWRILPPDFDPAQKHPLFVSVYGQPAGQTG